MHENQAFGSFIIEERNYIENGSLDLLKMINGQDRKY